MTFLPATRKSSKVRASTGAYSHASGLSRTPSRCSLSSFAVSARTRWATSTCGGIARDLFSLPLPPIYLECRRGLPYSRDLMPGVELVSGTSVPVQELPAELKGELTEYYDDGYLTLWHLISPPRAADALGFSPEVDVAAWRQQAHWSLMSSFLVEPDRTSIPKYLTDDHISVLSTLGTRVITAEGHMSTTSRIRPDTFPQQQMEIIDSVRSFKQGNFEPDPDAKSEVKLLDTGEIQVSFP